MFMGRTKTVNKMAMNSQADDGRCKFLWGASVRLRNYRGSAE
jgi:hypothetical protein